MTNQVKNLKTDLFIKDRFR